MDSQNTFKEELSRLARDLRRLRIERGNPSYRKLEARAARSRTGMRLPVATQSDAFRGKRLLALDTLMALVRILHAYDEYGGEIAVPPHNSPRLDPWRSRWRSLAALQPLAPGRPRGTPVPEPDAEPAAAAGREPAGGTGAIAAYRQRAREEHAAARAAEAASAGGAPATPPAPGDVFRPLARMTVAADQISNPVFSPDGRLLATSSGGTVHLWHPTQGRLVGEIDTEVRSVHALAISPDGRLLATGAGNRAARLWDLSAPAAVGPALLGHEEPIGVVAFSPDGLVLLTAAEDESVRRWDTATGLSAGPPLIGHFGEVAALAFLPDGGLLAALKGKHAVRVWDLVAGASVGEPLIGHEGEVHGMAFSPDGRLLATAGVDGARLWDAATGAAVGGPLGGPDRFTWGVAFSPDGRLLATACDDGSVRLWDPDTCDPVGSPVTGHDRPVHDIAFSPDGSLLAACGESGTMVVFRRDPDAAARAAGLLGARALAAALRGGHAFALPAVPSGIPTPLRRLVFSPDGRRLVVRTRDRTCSVWDAVTGARLPEDLTMPGELPWGLEFPDAGGPAALWTLSTGRPPRRPLSLLDRVVFSPDAAWVALPDQIGRIPFRKEDAPAATFARTPGLSAFALSPDGTALAAAFDGKVAFWNPGDPADPDPPGLEPAVRGSGLRVLALSTDGGLLATADADGAMELYARADAHFVRQFSWHTGLLHGLAFSPDGRLIATAGAVGTVRLWDTRSGESATPLPLTGHSAAVRGVAFSPDGSMLASAGDDGTLRRWVLPDGQAPTARPR